MQKPNQIQVEVEQLQQLGPVEVQRAISEMYSEASEELPGRIACLAFGKTDVAEIESIIRSEMRMVDEAVAAEIAARFGTPA